jgi:curved DNA-binding protein CbpA
MSKPLISVNFNDLTINLYDVLGVAKDATEAKIKKNFKKYVIELHPDKNPDSNDDIYNHVILANQVLSNSLLRKEYDNFLEEQDKKTQHFDLKQNFETVSKDLETLFPVKEEATGTFKSKINELNQKHGYNELLNNESIVNQYQKMKKNRDSQVTIQQEKISGNTDFNKKFESRVETGAFENQIIAVQKTSGLGTYQPNSGLATLSDYSKLYAEDSISTGSFTSLDVAFKIQKLEPETKEKTMKEKMEEYKNQSNLFSTRKPSDFSNKNFIDWNSKQ